MSPVERTYSRHMVQIKLMDLGSELVWEIQHGDHARGVRFAMACKRLREWLAVNS